MTPKLTFSSEAREALRVMGETTESVFVTGRAGTGKSTLLDWFRNHTKKKIAVLAPTGVAAVNVRGQTIHSFCKFGPDITHQTGSRKKSRSESEKPPADPPAGLGMESKNPAVNP